MDPLSFASKSFKHDLWHLSYYTLESPTFASWMPILWFLKVDLNLNIGYVLQEIYLVTLV